MLCRAAPQDNADVNLVSPTASFAPSLPAGPCTEDTGNYAANFQALAPAGGSLPHNNLQPYVTFYFNIALQGVFPPRP